MKKIYQAKLVLTVKKEEKKFLCSPETVTHEITRRTQFRYYYAADEAELTLLVLAEAAAEKNIAVGEKITGEPSWEDDPFGGEAIITKVEVEAFPDKTYTLADLRKNLWADSFLEYCFDRTNGHNVTIHI